jgi:hypothetical protein
LAKATSRPEKHKAQILAHNANMVVRADFLALERRVKRQQDAMQSTAEDARARYEIAERRMSGLGQQIDAARAKERRDLKDME